MLLSVPIAVLNMITLVFERIEGFVFDLPSGAATPHQFPYVLFGNGHIGYPAVMIGGFPFFIGHPVLKKIDLFSLTGTIERHIVYPLISVTFALAVAKLKLFGLSHGDDLIDPFKQGFVVCGFGYENIGHAVCLESVDKRLLGI